MAAKDEKEMAMNDVVYITAVICLLKVLNVVIFTGTMSWCPNNNYNTSCMYLYSDVDITCTTFLDIGLQLLFRHF